MKSIIFTLILLGVTISGFAQTEPFEGFILYKYTYLSPQGDDITEQMVKSADSLQLYFINKESYVSYNENKQFQQLYNSSTNRYFYPSDNSIMYIDASESFGSETVFEKIDEEKEILGLKCKGVLAKTGERSTVYFFSDEIQLDPKPFEKHVFGGFGPYLTKTAGRLSLQIVSKTDQYTMVMTAVKIQPSKLPEEEFDPEYLFKN